MCCISARNVIVMLYYTLLQELLTRHKSTVAEFLSKNYDWVMRLFFVEVYQTLLFCSSRSVTIYGIFISMCNLLENATLLHSYDLLVGWDLKSISPFSVTAFFGHGYLLLLIFSLEFGTRLCHLLLYYILDVRAFFFINCTAVPTSYTSGATDV